MSDPPPAKKPKIDENDEEAAAKTENATDDPAGETAPTANTTQQDASGRVIPEHYVRGVQPTTKHDEKWNEMFYKLQDFRQVHNHCLIPQKYPQDVKLGRWVHYQRVEFGLYTNRGQGKITPERIDLLEKVGFEWDPQRGRWNEMYNRLCKYKERFHHVQVPKGYKEDSELANWVRNQRLEYTNKLRGKKNRMTDERIAKLQQLGFTWSTVVQGLVQGQDPAQAQEEEQKLPQHMVVGHHPEAAQSDHVVENSQQHQVDESVIQEEEVAAVHAAVEQGGSDLVQQV